MEEETQAEPTQPTRSYIKWMHSMSIQSHEINMKQFREAAIDAKRALDSLKQTAQPQAEVEQSSQLDEQIDPSQYLESLKPIKSRLPRPSEIPPLLPRPRTRPDPQPAESHPLEIIINIVIFRAGDYSREILSEIEVLGSQPLTTLRDAIACLSDRVDTTFSGIPGDRIKKGPKNDSGYFFIDGVFYSDMRKRLARDYARVIVDWIKDSPERAQHFGGSHWIKQRRMEETKLLDLVVRINCPYLYVHQGSCEHVFMVRDVRLMHSADDPNVGSYPKTIYSSKEAKIPKCNICGRFESKFMSMDDERAPSNPCFWCETCFTGFHPVNSRPKFISFAAK